ncbi:MAG: peroxiredoxin [Chloroflexi bacterium]|nr:MAG: peroxiredoxin [Chloroflexota bacterium]
MSDFSRFPAPIDDGGAAGLEGKRLPKVSLPSTSGSAVDLTSIVGTLVLYVYPHATGTPDLPAPGWADIPGAIGCTAESCAFRDREPSFQAAGASVMGLSAQTSEAQAQFAARKSITFPLLSDPDLDLSRDPGLPTFRAGGLHLYKRLTLVAESGTIVKVFYPVFPPDTHPADVLQWLQGHLDAGK